jgi:hypothetical protein
VGERVSNHIAIHLLSPEAGVELGEKIVAEARRLMDARVAKNLARIGAAQVEGSVVARHPKDMSAAALEAGAVEEVMTLDDALRDPEAFVAGMTETSGAHHGLPPGLGR